MNRIYTDLNAFRHRVDEYLEYSNLTARTFATLNNNPSRHKDASEAAYEGLYKLMQRIKKELSGGNLSKLERKVCNAIAQDNFLMSLLELRTIAVHIKSDTARKRGYVNLYMPSGQPISIDPELSAGAIFAESTFRLPKPDCGISEFRHPDLLRTAKARIEKLLSPVSKG